MRDALARAIGRARVDPKAPPQRVPYDFALWQLGVTMGVPAWVFEGYALDQPPVEWVIRSQLFNRMLSGDMTPKRSQSSDRRTF